MSAKNRVSLVLVGFVIWAVATLLFQVTGSYLFERSAAEYWFNAVITGILYAAVSVELMKWWRIEQKDWLQGAVCIALPGMLGEIPILYSFPEMMSSMQPETSGRYAAFLLAGYTSLIGFSLLMSIKVNPLLTSDERFDTHKPVKSDP